MHRQLPHVYLAGRMTGLTHRGREWREVATTLLLPLVAENPLNFELDSHSPDEIVRVDVLAIVRSKAVLVSAEVPSWGTAMELWVAKQIGVPVIAWTGKDVTLPLSPWLRYVADEIHVSMAEAVNSIRERFSDYL